MPFIEHNGVRVLLIHIPKTGGTSVESWLRGIAPLHFFADGIPAPSRCTPQHYRMRDFRELFRGGYFDYAFAIVRNPFDRIASEYRMCAALEAKRFFGNWPSFSMWLELTFAAQRRDPFHLDNHIRPQWEFIGSEVEVFRLEDGLEAALAKAARLLGVKRPGRLPRALSTGGSPASVHWDRADRIAVRDFYHRDFVEFGYAED